MKYLKAADQFGASFSPYIGGNKDSEFRTYIGGLTSISIYAISLAYLVYEIVLWQTNQLIPIISTTQMNQELIEHQIKDNELIIAPLYGINAFDPQAQILLPIGIADDEYSLLQQVNGSLQFNGLNISSNQSKVKQIFFLNCTQYWEDKLQIKCAPKEEIKIFFSLLDQLQLNVTLRKYDVSQKSMISYTKQFYLSVDPNLPTFQALTLQTAKTEADLGVILPIPTFNNYLIDFRTIIQSLSQGYLYNFVEYIFELYNINIPINSFVPVYIIQVDVSNIQYQSVIQYPLLGTVLAQVGSIFSLLLMSSKLVYFLNSVLLEKYLIDEVIGYYYPEFKKKEIKEYLSKKNVSAKSKDKTKIHNTKDIGDIYRQSQKIALAKLSYLNIIYELSRIQFVLQSLQDREKLRQIHDIGIPLPLNTINLNNQVKKSNIDNKISNQNEPQSNNEGLELPLKEKQLKDQNIDENKVQNAKQCNQFELIESDMQLFTLLKFDKM